ncbi:unnamed protein product, partial [Allacma fusca]
IFLKETSFLNCSLEQNLQGNKKMKIKTGRIEYGKKELKAIKKVLITPCNVFLGCQSFHKTSGNSD